MEDRFPSCEEGAVGIAFSEGGTLLVDCELHYGCQVGEDIHAVFKTDG